MSATSATPHIERLDRLLDADLEVVRLLVRLRGLEPRLDRTRGHLDGPDARTPLRRA